jgi:hypothetical protein
VIDEPEVERVDAPAESAAPDKPRGFWQSLFKRKK